MRALFVLKYWLSAAQLNFALPLRFCRKSRGELLGGPCALDDVAGVASGAESVVDVFVPVGKADSEARRREEGLRADGLSWLVASAEERGVLAPSGEAAAELEDGGQRRRTRRDFFVLGSGVGVSGSREGMGGVSSMSDDIAESENRTGS